MDVGFGTGLNAPYYPATVTKVVAIEPSRVCMRIAAGCHLTRPIAEEVERAGFAIDTVDTYYFQGEPKPMAYTFEGRAVSR